MTEKDTVKDLMNQGANIKHLVDGINKAVYGWTMEEVIKGKEESNGKEKPE